MNNAMVVRAVEIRKALRDRRTKRKSGLDGLVVEFISEENIREGDVVKIGENPFKVAEITVEGSLLKCLAQETGYWAENLMEDRDFDIRSLMGKRVEKLTDEREIKDIRKKSLWT